MSGKKRKNKKKKNKRFDLNVCNLDYKRLSESIVKAEEIKSENEKECISEIKGKRQESWDRVLNQKSIPTEANWGQKIGINIRNIFFTVINMTFMKKKDVLDGNVTYGLFAFLTNLLFYAAAFILWAFSVIWFFSGVVVLIENFSISNGLDIIHFVLNCVTVLLSSVFIFFVGSVCRVAAIEVEKINDGNKIIGIFNAILTFVGVIVAIIGIFITTKYS